MSNPIFNTGIVLPQPYEKYLSDLDALYDEYAPALFGIIKKIVSDEQQASYILQKAFQNIWQQRAVYNPEKIRLFTWLYQMTYSAVMAYKNESNAEVVNNPYLVNKTSLLMAGWFAILIVLLTKFINFLFNYVF